MLGSASFVCFARLRRWVRFSCFACLRCLFHEKVKQSLPLFETFAFWRHRKLHNWLETREEREENNLVTRDFHLLTPEGVISWFFFPRSSASLALLPLGWGDERPWERGWEEISSRVSRVARESDCLIPGSKPDVRCFSLQLHCHCTSSKWRSTWRRTVIPCWRLGRRCLMILQMLTGEFLPLFQRLACFGLSLMLISQGCFRLWWEDERSQSCRDWRWGITWNAFVWVFVLIVFLDLC